MSTLAENIAQVNSDFLNIKNKIVEKGVEVAEGTRTAEYAVKVEQVYDAGKQAEYDAFWDIVQQNGERTDYGFAFSADLWSKATFKPKYPIKPYGLNNTFAYWGWLTPSYAATLEPMDLREQCDLDTSNCANVSNVFYRNYLVYAIGVMDFRKATDNTTVAVFRDAQNLETIEKVILKDSGTQNLAQFCEGCAALKNITFEGVIGTSTNFQWSTKLTEASIRSIINALSTTTSGLTLTLSKQAVDDAFRVVSPEGNDGSTTAEWEHLCLTRSNWTITLV